MVIKALVPEEIISNKDNIYLCAKAFRKDASALMDQLAQNFGFSILDCGAWPASVYAANYKNRVNLNAEWTFYLHGSHCRFDNLRSGQVVEVKYTEKPEFGCLDGFFFFQYMQTTDRFKDLAVWFDSDANVYAALDLLSAEGTLTRKSVGEFYSYIVAL